MIFPNFRALILQNCRANYELEKEISVSGRKVEIKQKSLKIWGTLSLNPVERILKD